MKFEQLIRLVGDQPVFHTGFLAAAGENLSQTRLQLSRWVASGRLIQLKKGLYVLAEPYRKVTPHPFLMANTMKKVSYVSLHSALAYYGIIPEYVPVTTSVTSQRPEEVETPLGCFLFQHIKKDWFHGYEQMDLGSGQQAFVATVEKALLDLVYLTPNADNYDFLSELRLQNLQQLNVGRIQELAERSNSRKLRRTAKLIEKFAAQEIGEEL